MLQTFDLSRSFGKKQVLESLSFTAPRGQITGLLGHNGSGKSTSLRILAGALKPTSGYFMFDGVPGGVRSLNIKYRTGYIPDIGGVFPRLTGFEHMQLASRLFGLSAGWEDRAEYLFDVLQLSGHEKSLAGTYSHGMSRKLSAAICLLPGPDLILADEPFDGVDAEGVETISKLLAQAAYDGASVVLATHLLDVAAALTTTSIHLVSGKVQ